MSIQWCELSRRKKEKTYLYVPLSKIKFILNDNLRGGVMEGMGSRGDGRRGEKIGRGDGGDG